VARVGLLNFWLEIPTSKTKNEQENFYTVGSDKSYQDLPLQTMLGQMLTKQYPYRAFY